MNRGSNGKDGACCECTGRLINADELLERLAVFKGDTQFVAGVEAAKAIVEDMANKQ